MVSSLKDKKEWENEGIEIDIEENKWFKRQGTNLKLGNKFEVLVECMIEGYDYEKCLRVCFNVGNKELFYHLKENQAHKKDFYIAKDFYTNKLTNKLNKKMKTYRNNDGLFAKVAKDYISVVKSHNKEELKRKDDAGDIGAW